MPDEETPEIRPASPAASKTKPFDPALRDALEAYRERFNLSHGALAKELGWNATMVSRYLNKKPEGDVRGFEARIGDVLRTADDRMERNSLVFSTSVVSQVAAVFESIRVTGRMGLLQGPAGMGKSCSVARYVAENPSTVHGVVSRWHSRGKGAGDDARKMESLIFAAVDSRSWPGNISRAAWLEDRLKGSRRLIVLDNAHRLTGGGLQWVFDFHDATGCPIALVGNPEVLKPIRKNDQMFSRFAVNRSVTLKDPEAAAAQMLKQAGMEPAGELLRLAAKIASQRGHLRALQIHLELLPQMLESPKAHGDPVTALRMAHTQTIADYEL